ncbi:uncharacterized protein [Periplaneta americana]|uniref:uncharacterized protein n=1 Tax=Periplaneta americana TaxID=6978 RepID=UPI0037E93C9D
MVAGKGRSHYYACVGILALICLGNANIDIDIRTTPNVLRAGDLMSSIMLFCMTTGSVNYDSYFFSPAVRAFNEGKINRRGLTKTYEAFTDFLAKNFSISRHAPDFQFSDTETKGEFLSRFLQYLSSSEAVPQYIKIACVQLGKYVDFSENPDYAMGFIKPLPIYITVRLVSLLGELTYRLRNVVEDGHVDSVETIVGFLTKDFDESLNGQGLNLDEGALEDILIVLGFGFSQSQNSNKPIVLSDGITASTKNKEFFQHILPTVSEDVKNAINIILPYL